MGIDGGVGGESESSKGIALRLSGLRRPASLYAGQNANGWDTWYRLCKVGFVYWMKRVWSPEWKLEAIMACLLVCVFKDNLSRLIGGFYLFLQNRPPLPPSIPPTLPLRQSSWGSRLFGTSVYPRCWSRAQVSLHCNPRSEHSFWNCWGDFVRQKFVKCC